MSRVALITGAASGIGKASSVILAQRGFKVVVADVAVENGNQVVKEITEAGGEAKFVKLDVGSAEEWTNAAGISGSRQPVEDTSLEEYERIIKITSTSVFLGCKIAGPELFKAGAQGSVINIASMMSHIGGTGRNPGYHAAKGAVRTLTKNIAISWAPKGVRVNSVHPGYIDTPLIRRSNDSEDKMDRLKNLTPLGRLGSSEEIAKVVAFLAGDDSSFMTGSELLVDGGFTAQ